MVILVLLAWVNMKDLTFSYSHCLSQEPEQYQCDARTVCRRNSNSISVTLATYCLSQKPKQYQCDANTLKLDSVLYNEG